MGVVKGRDGGREKRSCDLPSPSAEVGMRRGEGGGDERRRRKGDNGEEGEGNEGVWK